MTLINESFWSLQLEASRSIPLAFEEPEDFIYEICGKVLRRINHSERDEIAGRLRIYYADFELGWNHNVAAREILDTYQDTFNYADAVLNSDETPFSRRLNNLLGNEIENFNFLILCSSSRLTVSLPQLYRSLSWSDYIIRGKLW